MQVKGDTLSALAELIRATVGDEGIIAAFLYGSRVGGYYRSDSDFDVLAILRDLTEGLRLERQRFEGLDVSLLLADEGLFTLDTKRGALGDLLAGRILAPYQALINADYLQKLEVEAKERVTQEELKSLILEYGELSRGLLIKPEYFAISRLRKRAKAFLPARYAYLNIFRPDLREANLKLIMKGYLAALENLRRRNVVSFDEGFVKPTEEYVEKVLSRKMAERAINIFEESSRVLRSYFYHGKALYVNLESLTRELALGILRERAIESEQKALEDPKGALYLKTSKGTISLLEGLSIRDLIDRLKPGAKTVVTPLGGVINEVYLIAADDERLVAKKFTDWHGIKWFTLNIVSLGAKTFAMSGKARLSNEYGVNRYLAEHKIPVPEILHVSYPQRIIIEPYIEGLSLVEFIKKCCAKGSLTKAEREVAYRLGLNIAKVHSLGVALGDTKPENFIVTPEIEIYILDLEQASKRGDKAWDIAELLYYSGHYVPMGMASSEGLKEIVRAFAEGYAEAAPATALRKAASLNYVRVFSIWSSPLAIRSIVRILRSV